MNAERLKDLKALEQSLECEIEAAESVVREIRSQLHGVRMEITFEEHGVKAGYIVTDRCGTNYKVARVSPCFSSKPFVDGFRKTKDGWSKKAQNVYGWTNPRPE